MSHPSYMSHRYQAFEGPLAGLYLPFNAWGALHRENIRTLDQLRASVDRLERFDGIGPKTAQVIKLELARVAPLEEQPSLLET